MLANLWQETKYQKKKNNLASLYMFYSQKERKNADDYAINNEPLKASLKTYFFQEISISMKKN